MSSHTHMLLMLQQQQLLLLLPLLRLHRLLLLVRNFFTFLCCCRRCCCHGCSFGYCSRCCCFLRMLVFLPFILVLLLPDLLLLSSLLFLLLLHLLSSLPVIPVCLLLLLLLLLQQQRRPRLSLRQLQRERSRQWRRWQRRWLLRRLISLRLRLAPTPLHHLLPLSRLLPSRCRLSHTVFCAATSIVLQVLIVVGVAAVNARPHCLASGGASDACTANGSRTGTIAAAAVATATNATTADSSTFASGTTTTTSGYKVVARYLGSSLVSLAGRCGQAKVGQSQRSIAVALFLSGDDDVPAGVAAQLR
jgi:hypothetical protein